MAAGDPVKLLIVDPDSLFHRDILSGEIPVDGDGNSLGITLPISGTDIIDGTIPPEALSDEAKTQIHVDYKDSVRFASTSDENIATLAAGASVDSGTLADGDRVLLKDQTSKEDRGIYDIHAVGPATRSIDFDEDVEVTPGAHVPVEEGALNAGRVFILMTPAPITVGVTELTFGETPPSAHASTHQDGGTDELEVETLPTSTTVIARTLHPDGSGGLTFRRTDADEVAYDNTTSTMTATDVQAAIDEVEGRVDTLEVAGVLAHTLTHQDGGADELPADTLSESAAPGNDTSQALRPDGAGGVAWSDVAHSDLTGVGADDHHTEDHAARHNDGGADELPVAGLAEAAAPTNDTSRRLRPNGAGGVEFADVSHAELISVGIDDHHARDHASTHIRGGADEIDGDTLTISWLPANYTPSIAPTEVTNAEHLTAHLAGIDAVLASAAHPITSVFSRTGVVVAATSDYDAVQVDFTPNGDIVATNVQAAIVEVRDDTDTKLLGYSLTSHTHAHSAITGVGIDDHHARDHAATHILAGADEVDGDQLGISWNPTNYTPTTAPTEVTSLDHLTAHLAGIDAVLASAAHPITSVFSRTGVVVAATSDYDAVQVDFTPDGDIAATNVQAAIVEVRDDTDTKLLGYSLTSHTHTHASTTGQGIDDHHARDHTATHILAGADEIDGDQLGISWNPTNYTPTTAPTEVTSLDHLTAHLAGIDAVLASAAHPITSVFSRTGVVVAATSDYDAVQVDFTPNGDIVATNVQAAIVEVRDDTDTKLSGKASTTHASTHADGGTDELSVDVLAEAAAPANDTTQRLAPDGTGGVAWVNQTTSASYEWVKGAGNPPEVKISGTDTLVWEVRSADDILMNFELPADIDLATVDPVLEVVLATSSEDNGATNGTVNYQITARYVADTELFSKTLDETLTPDGGQPTIIDTLTERNSIAFTLSRALMAAGDAVTLRLENLGTGTFAGEAGVLRTAKLTYRTV